MDSYTGSDQKSATFNSALGAVIRMNGIVNFIVKSKLEQDASSWYYGLEVFLDECAVKMKPEKRDLLKERHNKLLNSINSWVMRKNRGQSTIMPYDLRNELRDIEQEIRQEADKADLLIPNKKSIYGEMELGHTV